MCIIYLNIIIKSYINAYNILYNISHNLLNYYNFELLFKYKFIFFSEIKFLLKNQTILSDFIFDFILLFFNIEQRLLIHQYKNCICSKYMMWVLPIPPIT